MGDGYLIHEDGMPSHVTELLTSGNARGRHLDIFSPIVERKSHSDANALDTFKGGRIPSTDQLEKKIVCCFTRDCCKKDGCFNQRLKFERYPKLTRKRWYLKEVNTRRGMTHLCRRVQHITRSVRERNSTLFWFSKDLHYYYWKVHFTCSVVPWIPLKIFLLSSIFPECQYHSMSKI